MPTEMVRVFAVPGRLVQDMKRPKQYIGYERVDGAAKDADHVVPGGHAYRIKPEGELVAKDSWIRQTLRDGDLTENPPAPVRGSSKKAEG